MIIKKLCFNKFNFKSFFKNLKIDKNDRALYNITPFRRRKILYTVFDGKTLKIIKKSGFSQKVSDIRNKKRKFSIFYPNKFQLNILTKLIKFVLKNFTINAPLDITFHFVTINASIKGETNSPEGIHRDGFDILVPCIVAERKNISGGYSRFFLKDKEKFNLFYNKITQTNYGLVFEENKHKDVFHDVTPIKLKNKKQPGYRSIIGIDITYLK